MREDEAMAIALEEARAAGEGGDVPIGAVVVRDGAVIARAHNEREARGDPCAHAELLAISMAGGDLSSATLIATLEPCTMCAGAIRSAGIGRVVFGAFDEKAGACGSRYNLMSDPRLGPPIPVVSGLRATEAAGLLVEFFSARR